MSIKSPLGRQLGTQFDSVFDVVKSNPMYDKSGGKIPSLDLNFAKSKSLRDSRSTKNLINFTRASTGTYVDSDGFIKTSPVNLLPYSEQIDQWDGLSNETITVNATEAPDGSMTADRLVLPASGSTFAVNSYTSTAGVHIGSLYVKAVTPGTNSNFTLWLGAQSQQFTATEEWQRISFSRNVTSDFRFGVTNGNDSFISDIYVWGSQVEEGTTATDYIPTGATISGAPRFDHDPVTGESLGLLVEENRTNLIRYSQDFTNIFWRNALDSSTVPSPDGNQNTYKITSNDILFQDNVTSAPANVSVVSSIFTRFAGAGNPSGIQVRVSGIGDNSVWANFDLVNGTIGNISATSGTSVQGRNWTLDGYGIEPFANGWYRIYMVHTVDTTTRISWRPSEAPATDTENTLSTGEVLVFGAQVEEGVFPTSYIPTTSSAVTRSPDIATIEGNKFTKTNLLQYSERFDQSVWTKQTSVALTPNSIAAPDGTTTGTLYSISASTQRAVDQSISSLPDGTAYVFSIYIKAIVDTTVKLRTSVVQDATIVEPVLVSEGWKRIQLEFTKVTNMNVIGFFDFSGSTGNRFYVWGAQLEKGSEVTEYTPSVDSFVSRASSATYVDDATGLITTAAVDAARYENGELLLEPARTNLLTYSEQFNQWIIGSGSSVTANQAVAPNGTNTADRVQHGTSGTSWIRQSILTSGNTYTISVYAKAVTPGTNNQFSFNAGPNTDPFIATSEWQRFSATLTATGNQFYINNGDDSYITDVYFWGAQVEAAPYASSYIPTTSTTVTRAADVSTSARGVDSWFNKNEWTVYNEGTNQVGFNWIIHDSSNDKRYGCVLRPHLSAVSKVFERTTAAGGGSGDIVANASTDLNGFIRSAFAIGSSANLYTNGLEGNTIAAFTNYPLAATEIALGFRGSYTPTSFINGHISRLAYFPTRLPDDKLKSITT